MQLLRAVPLIAFAHLRRVLVSRRLLVCALLALVPVAVATVILVASQRLGPPPAIEMGWLLQVQVVVPLIALVLGSAAVSEEVEDRTITYLFTRPIPRAAILLGRWAAAAVVTCALLGISTTIVFEILRRSVVGHPDHGFPAGFAVRVLQTALLGGFVYSGLFATLGAVLKRPIIVGLGYTFAVETFLANLPGSNRNITVLHYLKCFLFSEWPEYLERLGFDLPASTSVVEHPAATLFSMLAIVLTIGSLVITRKQYVLPS